MKLDTSSLSLSPCPACEWVGKQIASCFTGRKDDREGLTKERRVWDEPPQQQWSQDKAPANNRPDRRQYG